ncbi:MAG: helix-turn-helix domain-containing protein [Egibacteraceae bacterium]
MAVLEVEGGLLLSSPEEEAQLAVLKAGLGGHRTPKLVSSDGTQIELPPSVLRALHVIVEALAAGRTMTLLPYGKELTTQQAADLIRVSRQHLVDLLERGEIPHHRVGSHRRVNVEEVLAYRGARRQHARRARLDELTAASEEVEGGYR